MLLPIQLSQASAEPLYHQIKVQLRALILGGKLVEGTPLPSIRELALDLSCSVITIRRVYQDLENEGFIRTKQGTGTFVAEVREDERKRHRMEAVSAKFREAVDMANRYKCSPEDMHQLLDEAIELSGVSAAAEEGGEKKDE